MSELTRGSWNPALTRAGSRISHRHEGMINWLVANPHRPLGDLARELGYTQAWVSQLVHSDMFQARYRERCAELGVEVVHTMRDKLTGVTARLLDRIGERLEASPSEQFLVQAGKTLFGALGYGGATGGQGPQQHLHQHIHVDASTLIAARERAAEHFAGRAGGGKPERVEETVAA